MIHFKVRKFIDSESVQMHNERFEIREIGADRILGEIALCNQVFTISISQRLI